MFFAIEPNFEVTAKDVEKLFSFVRVRLTTAAARFDAKKMGLHGGLTPGQKFHADAGSGLQNLSLSRTDEARIFGGRFKKRKNIRAIKTRDAAERGNRRAHLAAFEGAEKTDGNFRGAGDLGER